MKNDSKNITMDTLSLGNFDSGKIKSTTEKKAYLKKYHQGGIENLTESMQFNDDDLKETPGFVELSGNDVTALQQFLFEKGFMPRGVLDGVFDYVTQSAVRLFQEYVRAYDKEGDAKVIPHGRVDERTRQAIDRWKSDPNKISEWAKWSGNKPTAEYTAWMALLNKAKADFKANPHPILQQVDHFNKPTDTRKVGAWEFDPNEVHLLGIRVDEDQKSDVRENNDLFILLIKGMVFTFWGSTDPSQAIAYNVRKHIGRHDEPFLVEGQHKYRFGWHHGTYGALKPYSSGVLVYRDRNDDNALTLSDIEKGLDPDPNTTINIHWSGIGRTNFSAGCQVISGQSYLNQNGEKIDCSHFAAYGNDQLGDGNYTKAAYNVLSDLIVCYSKAGVDHILYTLGRDGSLDLDNFFGVQNYVSQTIGKMDPKFS